MIDPDPKRVVEAHLTFPQIDALLFLVRRRQGDIRMTKTSLLSHTLELALEYAELEKIKTELNHAGT